MPQTDLKANPFMHAGHWYWTDEKGKISRAFASQVDALRDLLDYIEPPWWKRTWAKIDEFMKDTRA